MEIMLMNLEKRREIIRGVRRNDARSIDIYSRVIFDYETLQKHYKCVTKTLIKALQRRYKYITKTLQMRYQDVTKTLQRRYKEVYKDDKKTLQRRDNDGI
jgi:uncharacterized membrane-anchored protein YhcB (DUF1043 family)